MKSFSYKALLITWGGMFWNASAHAERWHSVSQDVFYPRASMEVRVGPYRPVVSSDPKVNALYKDVFLTQDRSLFKGRPLLIALEGDWYLNQVYGLLGMYGRVGWWRVQGRSRQCRDENKIVQCTPETVLHSEPGTDTASLSMVPVGMGAIYRMDLLKRQWNVPLLFHAKAGLDYHIWWGSLGNRLSRYHGSAKGWGGTLGLSSAVGVAWGLDAFSGRSSSYGKPGSLEASHYIFAEYIGLYGRGLDRKPRLDTSHRHGVVVGLVLDLL